MKKNIRLFLIDDHDSVRESYKRWLEIEGFDIAGESKTFKLDSYELKKLKPDIILMDIDFEGDEKGGLKCAKHILTENKNIKIIFTSHYTEPEIIREAVIVGCSGYFAKVDDLKSLLEIIEKVSQGYFAFSPTSLKSLLELLKTDNPPKPYFTKEYIVLNNLELKILNLVARGYSNKEIAFQLNTNEKRIKNIVANVLIKLDAKNRAHAVLKGVAFNLITDFDGL